MEFPPKDRSLAFLGDRGFRTLRTLFRSRIAFGAIPHGAYRNCGPALLFAALSSRPCHECGSRGGGSIAWVSFTVGPAGSRLQETAGCIDESAVTQRSKGEPSRVAKMAHSMASGVALDRSKEFFPSRAGLANTLRASWASHRDPYADPQARPGDAPAERTAPIFRCRIC